MTSKKISYAVLAGLLSTLCLNAQADTYKVCAKNNDQSPMGTLMGVRVYKNDPGNCPAFGLDNTDVLWPDETGTLKQKGLVKTKNVYACVYIQSITWELFKKVLLADKDTVILNSKVMSGHISYSLAITPNSCHGKN